MSRDSESPSAWYFINYLLATLEIFKTSKTIKSTEARDFRKLYASILSSKNETGRVERKIATGQEREEEKRYRGNATHDGRFRQTNVACSSKTSTVLRSRDAYACLLIARTDRTVSKKKRKKKLVDNEFTFSLLSATCLLSPPLVPARRRLRCHRFHFHRPPRGELAPINFLELRRATGVEPRLTLGKYASSPPLSLYFHRSVFSFEEVSSVILYRTVVGPRKILAV